MDSQRSLIIKSADFFTQAVVYVMSREQRVQDNHAIVMAQRLAMEHQTPLYVLFVLDKKRNRSFEHYNFMLTGLKQVNTELDKLNIPFIIRHGNRTEVIPNFVNEINAGALFFDFSPLKQFRKDIKTISKTVKCQVQVIDSHNIIPLWQASDKQEYAAYTFRSKVHNKLSSFLISPTLITYHPFNGPKINSLTLDDAFKFISSLPKNGIKIRQSSGEVAAHQRLRDFLCNELSDYSQFRNDIAEDHQSGLSPYLHFGQISSLRVVLDTISYVNKPPLLLSENKLAKATLKNSFEDGMNALFEELIVRKELADNFCFYNQNYKSLNGAPSWARKSLDVHLADRRDYLYNLEDWEAALTHDEIWNSAQLELTKTGKMHGYLRMYWAKKILEWSVSSSEAIQTAIYLNDKYSIDGADPNGYVGILWSIAGLHDRPWFDRPVFGQVRYMNESGIRRNYQVDQYIKRIGSLL